MNIRRNLRAFIKTNGQVMLRVRWNSSEVGFFVGYYAEPTKWDSALQRALKSTTHLNGKEKISAAVINRSIQDYENSVEDCFKSCESMGVIPEKEFLKQFVNEKLGKTKSPSIDDESIYPVFDRFVSDGCDLNGWSEQTVKKFVTLKNHLLQFDKKLTFNSLTEEKMQSFQKYLTNTVGYRNISNKKAFANFVWFLRWAEEKRYISDKKVIAYRPKLKEVNKEIVFLDWNEFMQLYNYQVPENKQYLQRIKDVWIFQATTGLRYSDVFSLRRTQIKGDYLHIVTLKTYDTIRIKLNKYSQGILRKYDDIQFPNGKALPVISNQKFNEYLKELGELAELNEPVDIVFYIGGTRENITYKKWELLTTHCARRTFVCNSLSLGATPEQVMAITGHSSYASMKPYIGLSDADRDKAIDCWDTFSKVDQVVDMLKSLSKEELNKILNEIQE